MPRGNADISSKKLMSLACGKQKIYDDVIHYFIRIEVPAATSVPCIRSGKKQLLGLWCGGSGSECSTSVYSPANQNPPNWFILSQSKS